MHDRTPRPEWPRFIHPRGPGPGDSDGGWRDTKGDADSAFGRGAAHSQNGSGTNGYLCIDDETLDDLTEPGERSDEALGNDWSGMADGEGDMASDPLMVLGIGVIALVLLRKLWSWYWEPRHCLTVGAACAALAAYLTWG